MNWELEEINEGGRTPGLIRRLLPEHADCFLVRQISSEAGKQSYAVYRETDKIVLEGTTPVLQAAALYRYLKEYCRVNLSWCGNRTLAVEHCPLPEKRLDGTVLQEYRAYMNYCTICYSASVWDWERWEKEIDFMALNGINMPLTVIGTEAVWYQTLTDLGLSEEEALSCISGPAYWAWQLMTNIDGFLPPPDVTYLRERLKLGRKILARERELGMTPIMQGFSGYVPKKLKEKYPAMKTLETSSWCGFPATCQMDPMDEMFRKTGALFLENQRKMLGYSPFLACDPFHENTPPSTEKEYLHQVGRMIDGLYCSFSKDTVWVMQSWSIYPDIALSVPRGRLLVLDINGHRYEETHGFWGHKFLLGDLHNFGGKNSLHGDIQLLAKRSYQKLSERYKNLCGSGLFMEGINQNPMYYEMGLEHLIRTGEELLEEWIADYAERRYQRVRREDLKALKLVAEHCYAAGTSDCERGSVICARSDLDVRCAAPNDVLEQRYDNRKLLEAVELLLGDTEHLSDGFLFDVCDFSRQLLSNHALYIYRNMAEAVKNKDKECFLKQKRCFLQLILDLDDLLSTREELRLSRWLLRAESLGNSRKMKEYYRKNVLTLITVWGPMDNPEIFDYAWREWSGLLKGYYYQRWKLFLDKVEADFDVFADSRKPDMSRAYDRWAFRADSLYNRIADFEIGFIATCRAEPEEERQVISETLRVLAKYREDILAAGYERVWSVKADLDFWGKRKKQGEEGEKR